MCALWLSATCRVCLASDREMYRLANTALEETYERVTGGTLVVEGWPCCVCGVCLSTLRRSRRFIDTAREANDALDRWSRNQPDRIKLLEYPLFSFTQSPMKILEISSQGIQEITSQCIREPVVKQELDSAENYDEANVPNEEIEIKFEVPSDNVQDHTPMLDNTGCHNTQVSSNSECTNMYNEMLDIKMDSHSFVDVKLEDNVEEGLSHEPDGRNQPSPVEDCLLKRPGNLLSLLRKSRKRAKPIEEPETILVPPLTGCLTKKHRGRREGNITGRFKSGPSTSEHLYKDTKPAAGVQRKEKKYSCHLCNYKTVHKYVLKDHLMRHTGEKPFSCNMCDYKCIQKRSLKYHLLIHSEEQKFSCNICGLKFTQKNSLLQHLLIHTGKKLLCCDMCDYKTIQKTSLKYHILTHTREKQFSCDVCGFKFSRKDTLKRHLSTHAGEKPFACEMCNFKCAFKLSLKQHILAHAGEKPFSCDICGIKFIRKDTLRRHLLTHATDKPFSCHWCDYKCIQKTRLKQHIVLTHNEEVKLFSHDISDFRSNK